MLKLLAKDSLYYLSSKLLVAALNSYIIFYLVSHFGSALYGELSIYLLVALTIVNFSTTWATQSYLRFYKKSPIDNQKVFTSLCLAIVFVALFSFLLSLLFSVFLLEILFLSISFVIYSFGRVFVQKKRLVKSFFILDVSRMLVIFLLVLFVFNDLKGIVLAFGIGNLLFIIPIVNIFKSPMLHFKRIFILKRWLNFGLPVAIWLTLASFQQLIDRGLIALFFSSDLAGSYSAVYDLALKGFALIILPVSNALYPILVNNEDEVNIKKFSFYSSLVSILISGFAFIFSLLVYDLMSAHFELAIGVLNFSFMVFGICLFQLGLIYQKGLELSEKTWVMLANFLYCILFGFLFNLYFSYLGTFDYFGLSLALSSLLYLILTYLSSINKEL